MRYIAKDEVERLLTTDNCVPLLYELFCNISRGKVSHKLRLAQPLENGNLLGIMPGHLPYCNVAGAKIITVYHDNFKKKLPSHQGCVLVFDTNTGALRGIVDGMAITAIRTAAASAIATDCLARKDSRILTLLGAGVQARSHLRAVSKVRSLEKAYVWSIFPDETERFVNEMQPGFDFPIVAVTDAAQAISESDIICTVTASKTPVLFGEWLKEGVHINAVGACQPNDRELDSECVRRSHLFGDSVLSVENEAGDYLFPLKEGVIQKEHLLGEIGDVLTGKIKGRLSANDITVFEALGFAAEDLICANWLLENLSHKVE